MMKDTLTDEGRPHGSVTLIPWDRIKPILDRHNDVWPGIGDIEAWIVRNTADLLRQSSEPEYHAEADELDALVDTVEAAKATAGR